MDTIVYIDGFNFYYGCLAGTPYKWLNIAAMCDDLLPPNKILAVKYFTARLQARPGDPDQPSRQDTYFKALRTDPRVEITVEIESVSKSCAQHRWRDPEARLLVTGGGPRR